jgi:hypothetical protein
MRLEYTGSNAFELSAEVGQNTYNAVSSLPHVFEIASVEKMRLDASGNLLVGKTVLEYVSNAGVILRNDCLVSAVRSGGNVVNLNRLSSDGEIVQLNKDGVGVGSIGVAASDRLYIGQGDTGLRFAADSNLITPWNPSTNSNSDNLLDLGNSTNRWKNVYVGTGVYLGGTGAANKLDDYEEGAWIPTINSGTFTATSATYTKIGNLVTVRANLNDLSDHLTATNISVGGLPFLPRTPHAGPGPTMFRYFGRTDASQMNSYVASGTSAVTFYWSFTSGVQWENVTFADGTQTNMDLIFSVSYETDL